MDIRKIALEFLALCAAGQAKSAFARHAAKDLVHHNPHFPAGTAALILAMEQNAASHPAKTLEVQRTVSEGDLVVVHSRVRMGPEHPGIAVVHILRFNEGRIAELWDLAQAVPENMPNEHGMF